jgi:mannose-6-phosphate isomerase-like protein (cupin superfamily)
MIDPSETYVLLTPEGRAEQLSGGMPFWSRPSAEIDQLAKDWLITEFECATDWPNWEMHPEGDEFVYLLAGEVTLQLQSQEGQTSVPLHGRGATVIPKGVWHTAKVAAPSRLLFVTLGAGTQHRPA